MNNHHGHRQSAIVERTAETLRDQLESEFVAIHRRRKLSRRIARISTVATLVCFATVGLWWSAKLWPGLSDPSAQLGQGGGNGQFLSNEGSGPTDSTPIYSAIQVTDLSDEELRSLLVSTQAQWFVAEIDGTPTAFPLEPSTRKKL